MVNKNIWKEYPECNDYIVSTDGNVRSKFSVGSHEILGSANGKILNKQLRPNGYEAVGISINKRKVKRYIHRMVAVTHINNKENKKEVNHKNGIRNDNRVENLEWCTTSENHKHSFKELGRVPAKAFLGRTGSKHHASKPIYCSTLSIAFGSARQCAKQLGLHEGSISHVCNGERLHTKGLVFRYI